MAKNTFNDFSTTASSNTDIAGIGIQGANQVRNFDDAFRTLMAILRRDLDNGVVFASKSSNYTAVSTDNNGFIRFSAAATLSLTAAATLGADWHLTVMADGGDVVIDPNGSETINGTTTITIPDGYSTTVICDGTNFRAKEDYATTATALASLTSSLADKVAKAGDTMTGDLILSKNNPALQLEYPTVGKKLFYLGNDGITRLTDSGGTTHFSVSSTGAFVTQQIGDLKTALDAKAAATALFGVGQTWQDVTASRSANTVYQNTTGKTISVAPAGSGSVAGQGVYVGTTAGSLVLITELGGGNFKSPVVQVPPGHYYRFTTGTLTYCAELRS